MAKKKSSFINFISDRIALLILVGVSALCAVFMITGTKSENGSITLDGSNAKIQDYTEKFIEDANEALYRVMNVDAPTDDKTIAEFEDATGQGSATSIEDVIGRMLPDGNNDGGKGWQCSKYTGYLATGKREYSKSHPDYGPVNGKDVAAWLVKNYGWKYTNTPVKGAIGSGGFNTTYGHTAMYLYSTGNSTAMVNDANWTPLKVGTHNMSISGWVWVVPGDYKESKKKTNTDKKKKEDSSKKTTSSNTKTTNTTNKTSTSYYIVQKGDTLGSIAYRMGWYNGNGMFGNNGYAQGLAERNGIVNRGIIYPGTTIYNK